VGFLSTEYDLRPHGVYEPWDFFLTNHIEENYPRKNKKYSDYKMLNLNAVIADRYRAPARETYAARYFDQRMLVSTYKKNISKFARAKCDPLWYNTIDWSPGRETLRTFYTSLYLEDVATHTIYSHMGARFYEALACGTVPIFDVSCANTIARSGYDIPPSWIVATADELHARAREIIADWPRHHARVIELSHQAEAERDTVMSEMGSYLSGLRTRIQPRRLSAASVRDTTTSEMLGSGVAVEAREEL
jgi:hypothetical protein